MDNDKQTSYLDILSHPKLGSGLTLGAGLAFYTLCILLPLVGPMGIQVPHHTKNLLAFAAVLTVTLVLSGLALASTLLQRRQGGDRSLWTAGTLFALSAGVGIALICGALHI